MVLAQVFNTGALNSGVDSQELFLKTSTGELVAAYDRVSVTEGRFRSMTLPKGTKIGQFKVPSRTTPVGHVRGQALDEEANTTATATPEYGIGQKYLDDMNIGEIEVGLDRALTRNFFFDELDEFMDPLSPQLRMEATKQIGEAISRTVDKRRLITLSRGAQEANGYNTELPGGVEVTKATVFSDATATMEAFEEMAGKLDDNETPNDGRMVFVSPTRYYWMVNKLRDHVINRDYGGSGSVAGGTVSEILGFEIIKTTQKVFDVNINTVPEGSNTVASTNNYTVDNTNVEAIFGHRDSLGVVQPSAFAGGPRAMVINQDRRLGDILGAKWYGGCRELRRESCGLIRTA